MSGILGAEGPIEKSVLLAFDAYHDNAGQRPPFPEHNRQLGSDMYTSNTLIRDACRRHSGSLAVRSLGASISRELPSRASMTFFTRARVC